MDANIVTAYLRMLTTFVSKGHGFIDAEDLAEGDKPIREPEQDAQLVKLYTAISAVWSLGGNIHENSRKRFVEKIRPLLQKFCPEVPDGDLYMKAVDDEKCCFIEISSIVEGFNYDPNEAFFNILVPTNETTQQFMMLRNLMRAGFHTMFSGDTGVGKSVVIQQFLNTAGDSFTTATANFSAQTSTSNVVDLLENRLERKRKNLLGAPPGTTMLFFVDDMNMPMLENYGAQPPIELLRQVIDYGGFYDNKKLFWKNVADTQFIAACGPPGGGRMVGTKHTKRERKKRHGTKCSRVTSPHLFIDS